MPISPSNLRFLLSGGAGNADPAASLGGMASATAVGESLFDQVTGNEAHDGTVDYRCVYFLCADPNGVGLIDPVLSVESDTDLAIGLGGRKNQIAASIPDDETMPLGVGFASTLVLPDGPYVLGDQVAIWIRRTTAPGMPSSARVAATLRIEGDTY